MTNIEHTGRLKWFIERIGKTVYRPRTTCKCDTCERIYLAGLVISDEYHAIYVEEIEAMYQYEGYPVKYFDTREELAEYIKANTIPNSDQEVQGSDTTESE